MVEGLRAGQERARADLYNAYALRLFNYCAQILRDPPAAEDAVQDALLAAYVNIAELRNPDRLRPWLYAIARNECLKRLRERRRTHPLTAVILARTGRAECAELDRIIAGSDPVLTPLLRKRINRHADGCGVCGQATRDKMSPEALLNFLPVLALPGELEKLIRYRMRLVGPSARAQSSPGSGGASGPANPDGGGSGDVGGGGTAQRSAGSAVGYVFGADGFPRRPGRRSRRRLVLAVAAALIVLAIGAAGTQQFSIVPSCASDLTFQVTSDNPAVAVSPASGSLQDGQNIPITVTPDTSTLHSGETVTITVTTSDGLTQSVTAEFF